LSVVGDMQMRSAGVTGEDVIFLDCSSAADSVVCVSREIRNTQTAIDAKNESI